MRVEVAVDGYGTADLPDSFIAAMTDAGVSFHAFDPQPRLVGMRTNLFRRLHRKIVVVDGERAFIGGINYSADHLGDFGAMAKQDYAVEVAGPVVAQVHAASKRLMSPVLQPPSAVRPLTEPAGTCSAVLVERDNGVRSTDIEAHYLQAFRSARQRIVVANAYFFPGYRLMRELRNASRRGVEVRLILQGQPDMRWVRALSTISWISVSGRAMSPAAASRPPRRARQPSRAARASISSRFSQTSMLKPVSPCCMCASQGVSA